MMTLLRNSSNDPIAILIKFDNVRRASRAKRSARNSDAHSEFLFCLLNLLLFLFSCFAVIVMSVLAC